MQFRPSMRRDSKRARGISLAAALVSFGMVAACSGADATDDASGGGDVTSSSRPSGAAQYKCPAPPSGVDVGVFVGDQLPEIHVKDCDGQDVSLNQFCGSSAMWLYVVHAWCPHCKKVGTFAESLADSYTSKNVVSVQIVYQNTSHAPATAEDCRAWRDGHSLENNITLYDPTGATKALNDSTFTSLSLFIDRERVIRGKSHTDDEGSIRTGIDALLSKK